MKEKPDHRTPPTAEELARYRNGEMSAVERHALEKKLEASEFYRDAEEGLSSLPTHVSTSDIKGLREKLYQQEAGRNIWYLPLRIAAGLAVIFIVSWLIFDQLSFFNESNVEQATTSQYEQDGLLTYEPEEEKPIDTTGEPARQRSNDDEQEEKVAPFEPLIDNSDDLENVIALDNDVSEDIAEAPQPVEKIIPEASELPAIANSLEIQKPAGDTAGDIIMEDAISDFQIARAVDKKMALNLQGQARGLAIQSPSKGSIKGRVISAEDMMPLPGVNVLVKGTSIGTITNLEGEFSISIPDTLESILSFSFIGLMPTEFEVQGYDNIEVALSSDVVQLSEVVVTGYGADQVSTPPLVKRAKPENGFRSFRRYLKENMEYPDGYDEKQVVQLQFTILTDGSLANISVLNSPAHAFEEEAIRLLKEYPKWEPAKVDGVPKEEDVTIKIKFKPD